MCRYPLYSSHSLTFTSILSPLYWERNMYAYPWTYLRSSHFPYKSTACSKWQSWQYFSWSIPSINPIPVSSMLERISSCISLNGTQSHKLRAHKTTQYFPTIFIQPFNDTLQKSLLVFHIFYPLQGYSQRGRRKFLGLLVRNNQSFGGSQGCSVNMSRLET